MGGASGVCLSVCFFVLLVFFFNGEKNLSDFLFNTLDALIASQIALQFALIAFQIALKQAMPQR